MYSMPYAVLEVVPSSEDRVTNVSVDHELGNEGFTYQLESGLEGTVHIDHVLNYNQDPNYMADLVLYKLTVEAQHRLEKSPIGLRQLARRLNTSPSQLYRLLDTTNYKKSVRSVLNLLYALDCEVDFVVQHREAV